MSSGGNWVIGFLLLVALAAIYPVAAAVIGGLVLLEFLIRRAPRLYLGWLRSHGDIRSRELGKASHGAGLILIGWQAVELVRAGFAANQQIAGTAVLIFLAVLLFGLFWLCSCGYYVVRTGSAGALDNGPLVRGVLKFAAGSAFFYFNPVPLFAAWSRIRTIPDFEILGFLIGLTVLSFAALWCIGTGATKVLLLVLAKIRLRRSNIPAPMANPHGSARAASRRESGNLSGGNKSRLDNQRF